MCFGHAFFFSKNGFLLKLEFLKVSHPKVMHNHIPTVPCRNRLPEVKKSQDCPPRNREKWQKRNKEMTKNGRPQTTPSQKGNTQRFSHRKPPQTTERKQGNDKKRSPPNHTKPEGQHSDPQMSKGMWPRSKEKDDFENNFAFALQGVALVWLRQN